MRRGRQKTICAGGAFPATVGGRSKSSLAGKETPVDAALARALVGALQAEVNNGGFEQFFFNSAGDRTREIIEALSAIGAPHTASIVGRAAAKFPGGLPPEDRFARQRLLLERVSPDSDAFSEEDAAFLEHREEIGRASCRERA